MLQLTTLIDIVKRLNAALQLVKLAEEVIPGLITGGRSTKENGSIILSQIPALRADIDRQIENAKHAMEGVQDRIEVLTQFLLLHRGALNTEQAERLDQNLKALRG